MVWALDHNSTRPQPVSWGMRQPTDISVEINSCPRETGVAAQEAWMAGVRADRAREDEVTRTAWRFAAIPPLPEEARPLALTFGNVVPFPSEDERADPWHGPPLNWVPLGMSGFAVVSDQVRILIERLEPGRHFFWRLPLEDKDTGEPLAGESYFFLQPAIGLFVHTPTPSSLLCLTADNFSRDRIVELRGDWETLGWDPATQADWPLNKDLAPHAHLALLNGSVFIASDALFEAFRALRIPTLVPKSEFETVQWRPETDEERAARNKNSSDIIRRLQEKAAERLGTKRK